MTNYTRLNKNYNNHLMSGVLKYTVSKDEVIKMRPREHYAQYCILSTRHIYAAKA